MVFEDRPASAASSPGNNISKIFCRNMFTSLFSLFQIMDHHVPVPLVDLQQIVTEEWDPAIRMVVPYIDGKNFVKRISILSDVQEKIAKNALQHLLFYKCVTMIDIFQFSNRYRISDGKNFVVKINKFHKIRNSPISPKQGNATILCKVRHP